MVEQTVAPRRDRQHGTEAGAGGDGEHQENLVLHRQGRWAAGEDLAGHHAGEADEAGGGHHVDGGDHAGAHGFAADVADGLLPALAEHEAALDVLTLAPDGVGEAVEAEGDAVHGVAEHHAQQRDGVLGLVPGVGADDDEQGHHGDGEGGDEHGRGADAEGPAAPEAAALAHHDFTAGQDDHCHAHQGHPAQGADAEQGFEDEADKRELDGGTYGGDYQGAAEAEADPPGAAGEEQYQHGSERQLPVFELNQFHGGPPPAGGR